MSSRGWKAYVGVAVAAVAGYFLMPNDSWPQTIYAEGVGLLATGAVVVGVVKHRPAAKAAWLWFAAGQLLNVLGTLAEAVIGRVLHLETWPPAADALWRGGPGRAVRLPVGVPLRPLLLLGSLAHRSRSSAPAAGAARVPRVRAGSPAG